MHLAHRLRPEFPDGVLHVNLLGYSTEQTMSVSQALRYFLRALGVPAEQVPLEQDEQEVVFQTLLTGKRVLMLLDNAADADQVRRLLPVEPGCACYCCANFSRAYVRHLVNANEILAAVLLTMHNVHLLLTLAREMRAAIAAGTFAAYAAEFLEGYQGSGGSEGHEGSDGSPGTRGTRGSHRATGQPAA